nr:putative fad-binding protein c12c2.03c [Quercus suber]
MRGPSGGRDTSGAGGADRRRSGGDWVGVGHGRGRGRGEQGVLAKITEADKHPKVLPSPILLVLDPAAIDHRLHHFSSLVDNRSNLIGSARSLRLGPIDLSIRGKCRENHSGPARRHHTVHSPYVTTRPRPPSLSITITTDTSPCLAWCLLNPPCPRGPLLAATPGHSAAKKPSTTPVYPPPTQAIPTTPSHTNHRTSLGPSAAAVDKLRARFDQLHVGGASFRSTDETVGVMAESNSSSDSEAPSTPLTEPQDVGEVGDKIEPLPLSSPGRQRKRRASTTYASNSEEIKRLLGDGQGTRFLQKYCCGEGCCMLEALPARTSKPGFRPIEKPDNDAFRFLDLKLATLALDTPLTKILDLPEKKVSFAAVRKESMAEKFPDEGGHEHSRAAIETFAPRYMQPHPPYNIFSAPVHEARELTKPGAEKRTFHFDIDVTDYPEEGGVDFKVGGAIGVCPPNDPAVVDDILTQLGVPKFQRDKPLRMMTTGGRWPTIWGDEKPRQLLTTRREVLTWAVDITSTAPTKPVYRVLAEHAQAPNEKKILTFLASAQGQAAFCDLRTGPHITLQQLLHAFPSSKPPLDELCGVLSQLAPRFYSLSNDPHVSSARDGLAGRRLIEIAVTIHETPSFTGVNRTGVGSGFMERIASSFVAAEEKAKEEAEHGDLSRGPGVAGRQLNLQIPMFRGLMSNPLSREFASDGPMVLIGAGVGMAPFRGFILNRLKNANCANKIWLIQGIRDSMLDEIYKGELGANESQIKKVVQSRAKPPPVAAGEPGVIEDADDDASSKVAPGTRKETKVAKYVQDEVRQQADIVWFAINAVDGRIFVCGSTKGMGEGVESALIDVAMDKGHLDYETAKQFWEGKKAAGQYIAETW